METIKTEDELKHILYDKGFRFGDRFPSVGFVVTYLDSETMAQIHSIVVKDPIDGLANLPNVAKMAKEELTEKYYKNQIKTAIKGDNRYDDLLPKLYKTDDYLKKHISLENWKKASEDFISYYLKNGYFEGHKKYFD